MSLQDYLNHYLVIDKMLIFLLVALGGAFLCTLIVILSAKARATGATKSEKKADYYDKAHDFIQRFYEMIFAASSILTFLSAYYLIERFTPPCEFRTFWDAHSDMLLLVMIIISCVINSILDHAVIPLKKIDHSKKASVRLVGMLYIIMIFLYIKYIYENDNYDGFIMYFLGLMIGRFVYFDASFKDFLVSLKDAAKNLPLLILGLAYTGLMCLYGFTTEYLLKSNGVLVSTFFAHVFMIVAIFIIYHTHIIDLFVPKPKNKASKGKSTKTVKSIKTNDDDYDYDDDYDDYTTNYSRGYDDDDDYDD